MPLSDADFVHENSGAVTTAGTSHVVSLAGADSTVAGNTVLVFMKTGASGATPPAGFVVDKDAGTLLVVFRKSDVAAGEGLAGSTPWTFTTAGNTTSEWYVVELSNVDPVEPLDASVTATGGPSNGGTLSTGTTLLNAGLHTAVFAAFGATKVGASTESWSGYTNGFEEVVDLDSVGAQLAVARKFVTGTTGTFSTTATLATTQGGAVTSYALIVAYRSADSPIVAPLAHFVGFEWGTHGGINSHTTPSPATNMMGSLITNAGTWGTNYLIQAGSARSSNYGLRVTQAAAATSVIIGSGSLPSGSVGCNVRVVSATGTPIVFSVMNGSLQTGAQLLYDATNQKLGVRAGTTGTVSWESGTTPLNTWRWVDLRVKTNTSTWLVEWRVETGAGIYTDQAAASQTGQTPGNRCGALNVCGSATQTMTADLDDICISNSWTAYPLGPHEVKLLTVDPAGTPSVSGTSTNFSVFTANGTLAAWNAVNARNAVDEVPPTISASADGVVQTAVAASDYIEFPMATYALGPDETCVGVRMLCPEWGGTGTGTGTIGYRGWDGTTETVLIAASASYDPDSLTAISSTHPRWACAMWQSVNGWTQAELDAAAVRVGFSTDATPDMGVHAVYLEIAVGKTRSQQLFGDLASLEADPNRGGAVSITVDAAAGQDADLYYEEGGSPTTVPVTGGTSHTEQINAVFVEDTNYAALYLPPEPAPVD